MIAHPLSALYDMAHGATLSITIPAWMTWAHSRGNKKVEQFCRNVMGVAAGNSDRTVRKGVEELKGWFQKIGSPVSLSEASVPESDLDRITGKVLDLAKIWGVTGYGEADVKEIFGYCK